MLRALFAMLATGTLLAAMAPAQAAAPHYSLDQSKSTLEFKFTQAGAQNKGHFGRFAVSLDFSRQELATAHLEVQMDTASVDTGDKDRDDTLKSAEMFSVQKFPQAHFSATQVVKTATGFEAQGKLTIRDVTRDTRLPFTFRTATEQGASVGYMAGKVTIKRLDFGVGQGEWKDTDQVGNDVVVSFSLRLTSAAR